jgi:hypothetical protein
MNIAIETNKSPIKLAYMTPTSFDNSLKSPDDIKTNPE